MSTPPVTPFRAALDAGIADPGLSTTSHLPLTAAERRRIVIEWNDTARAYPRDKCIHQLFEEQVARAPNAVALVCGDRSVTYRELNARANQLARGFREAGVTAEARVGLLMGQSPEAVVAILAILKAGGAYVPLDPNDPAERLRLIANDAGITLLVTGREPGRRSPDLGVPEVKLDVESGAWLDQEDANLPPASAPTNLAYIMYTSGSTGEPKGVLIENRSVVRLVHGADYATFGTDRVFLQLAPLAFDASTFEIWGALLHGGRLVLAPDGPPDFAELARLIRDQGVTTVWLTAGLFNEIVEARPETLAGVSEILTGGEALSPKHVLMAYRSLNPRPRIINGYGPTESTTFACCHDIDPDKLEDMGSIPIGRPIGNTRAYVLDNHGHLVPEGVAGELHLAGDGLARGYLNRPEATAERFIVNHALGERLYRTGDRARWRGDGTLEFLGRSDDQVKLRGFRIELGEIEAALSRLPTIRQAVVVVREDRPGDRRLVAYLVTEAGGVIAPDRELRDFLAQSLPEYMVPLAFVHLDLFPLNSNGKLDRKALPPPRARRSNRDPGHVAPRDAIEAILAAIWKDVLQVGEVGVHDNFFDLGGNSLLAARATTRAGERLGLEISTRILFENPTIDAVAARISGFRPREDDGPVPPLVPIRERRGGALPLSFAQQRLWFLQQLERGSSAYNMPFVCRTRGVLDVESLRCALEGIVARHEPLRTTFDLHEGSPTQRVHAPGRFELAIDDIRDVDVNERASIVAERTRQEADRPFELESDVPLRASLLRLADDDHMLLLTMHHIASDGWSMTVFWRELAEFYNGLVRGERPAPPALAIQYADYAAWQRTTLEGDRLSRLVDYWRGRLQGVTPLDLPADRPRRSPSYRGATHEFALPARLVERVRTLAREAGATLNMVLLASFQLLLLRHCGQEDVAVGLPASGRGRSQVEGLIGFFVNTLVVRVDLAGNPSFLALLERVKSSALDAYDHQDLPFEMLVERLRPERELKRNPLVHVIFQLMEFAPAVPNFAELAVSVQPVAGTHVRFDLEMCLVPRGEGLRGEIAYRTDLFDETTIARFGGHFRTLLEGIVADPDECILELPLLSAAERRRIASDWNDTARAYPRDKCIHQLFEEQVARAPNAVSLVCGDRSLTYGELNAWANQLARGFREAGVTAEARVGLLMGRSPEAVVAILAILKAGGAYVPLDPNDPAERLRLIANDAGITLLVTGREPGRRSPDLGVPEVNLDVESGAWLDQEDANLPPASAATNLAYIMYTSGSTGEPKGVLIENRSVVRLVHGADYATFGPDRVFLQLAPLAFDASTFEIWGALLHGGRLVLAPDGPPDLAVLGRLIRHQGVTTIWLTAGLFNEIVDARPETLAGVNEILTGGEALSPKHVLMAFRSLNPRPRIINGYGPTESTTFACCHDIDPDKLEDLEFIPIGRPIGNTRAYVLDNHGHLVPEGVAGELHLAGDGLARGYLNRPEATAERFIVNHALGERLYRTGDRAQWRGDGTLEFLGRSDDQVKLRGFRIELGEIELTLSRHPAIRQAAVLMREDCPGDRRLVAYVVTDGGGEPDCRALHDFLARTLPEHMVPSAFVGLRSIPLNANGKVDRAALPAPLAAAANSDIGHVGPRDAVEEKLTSIWQDVLGTTRIGIHDDFFATGGHSLLAIRLLARIEKDLGVTLPLSTVFRAGTIAAMARIVDRHETTVYASARGPWAEVDDLVVPLQPNGDRPPVFMLPGMGGHVISLRDLAILIGTEQPVYGLQPTDHDLGILACSTVEDVASVLIKAMKRVATRGPYNLLGFSAGGVIAYEIARQLMSSGEPVGLVGLLDTYGPCYARLLPLHVRLVRHLKTLNLLRPGESFEYAVDRGQALVGRLHRMMNSSCFRITQVRARRSLTDQTSSRRWHDVINRYRHLAFPGSVDLFAADKPDWLGTDFGDPTMGWSSVVGGEIRLHRITGRHLEIIKRPYANDLAAAIRTSLLGVESKSSVHDIRGMAVALSAAEFHHARVSTRGANRPRWRELLWTR